MYTFRREGTGGRSCSLANRARADRSGVGRRESMVRTVQESSHASGWVSSSMAGLRQGGNSPAKAMLSSASPAVIGYWNAQVT